MWEKEVRIYGTPEVSNNFPKVRVTTNNKVIRASLGFSKCFLCVPCLSLSHSFYRSWAFITYFHYVIVWALLPLQRIKWLNWPSFIIIGYKTNRRFCYYCLDDKFALMYVYYCLDDLFSDSSIVYIFIM